MQPSFVRAVSLQGGGWHAAMNAPAFITLQQGHQAEGGASVVGLSWLPAAMHKRVDSATPARCARCWPVCRRHLVWEG